MAVLQVSDITPEGTDPNYRAAEAGGDEFPNDGRTLLHVKNTGGADVVVTIQSQRACDQGHMHHTEVDVPAGEDRQIGPLSIGRYSKADGRVEVTYSAVAGVQVAASSL